MCPSLYAPLPLSLQSVENFSDPTCTAESLEEDESCELEKKAGTRSPCWMQALYRLPEDMVVAPGDILRLQAVHLTSGFVFGVVSNGLLNSDARLVKFIALDCVNGVQVFAFCNDKFEYIETEEATLSPEDIQNEYLLGTITAKTRTHPQQVPRRRKSRKKISPLPTEAFTVLPARVNQMFKISVLLESGKRLGMLYQLPDSNLHERGSVSAQELAKREIPLDEYRITCPADR